MGGGYLDHFCGDYNKAPIAQACPQVYAVVESNDSARMVQDWLDSSSADSGEIELATSRDRARREIELGSACSERPAQRPRLAHDIPTIRKGVLSQAYLASQTQKCT
jgi:hypothetical protein